MTVTLYGYTFSWSAQAQRIRAQVAHPCCRRRTRQIVGNLKAHDRYGNNPELDTSISASPRFMRSRHSRPTRRGVLRGLRETWPAKCDYCWRQWRPLRRQCCRPLLLLSPWQRWQRMTFWVWCEVPAVLRRRSTVLPAPGTRLRRVSNTPNNHQTRTTFYKFPRKLGKIQNGKPRKKNTSCRRNTARRSKA